MNKTLSTLIGFAAILTWAFLALLSTVAGNVPPFQLAAMTFFLGGLVGASSWIFRPHAVKSLRQPWQVWAMGVADYAFIIVPTSSPFSPHRLSKSAWSRICGHC